MHLTHVQQSDFQTFPQPPLEDVSRAWFRFASQAATAGCVTFVRAFGLQVEASSQPLLEAVSWAWLRMRSER